MVSGNRSKTVSSLSRYQPAKSGGSIKLHFDPWSTAITNLLFALLITRSVLDIVFPGTKPSIAVALYLLLTIVVMIMAIIRSHATRVDYLLSILLPITTLVSILNAPYAVLGQVNFGSQCFIPVIFLLLLSQSRSVDFNRLRHLFLRYGMAIIFVCVAFAIFSQDDPDVDALEYLNDNPMHSTAQLLAKAALVFIGPLTTGSWTGLAGAFITIGAIAALNVRSTMLGLILGLAMVSRRFLFLCIVGGLALAVLAFIDFGPLHGFLDRLLFKGRDFLGNSTGNLSSGRTDVIWPHYVSLIVTSSFTEMLFGHGATWLFTDMVLFAHNDFLTLLSTYGMFGFFVYMYAWVTILRRLDVSYRTSAILLFMTLFITNGVITYQSNVLLALLFANKMPRMSHNIRKSAHNRKLKTSDHQSAPKPSEAFNARY